MNVEASESDREGLRVCKRCGRKMAEHEDRYSCGYCGYTEYKRTEKPK